MRYLLKYDGWAFHPALPLHWMYKYSGNKLVFCSPEGKLLDSRGKAEELIKSRGGDRTEKDLEKFKSFPVSRGSKAGQNKSDGTDLTVSEHSLDDSVESTEIDQEYYDESD